MGQKILIIDDERNIRRTLDMILTGEGYEVFAFESGKDGLDILQKEPIEVALLDIVMPDMNGLELLPKLLKIRPNLAVIMISGHSTVQDAVQATKLGAYDFLEKPLSREKVLLSVAHAHQTKELATENQSLKKQIEGRHEMVGESRALQNIRDQIAKVAPSNGRVLILGDSGTGKELIARAVHIARVVIVIVTVCCVIFYVVATVVVFFVVYFFFDFFGLIDHFNLRCLPRWKFDC